jgi:hypothetical protein
MTKETWHTRDGFHESEDGEYRIVKTTKRWMVYKFGHDLINVSPTSSVITDEYINLTEFPDGNWKKPPADGFATLKEAKQYVEDLIEWFHHLSNLDRLREQYERDTGFRKPR